MVLLLYKGLQNPTDPNLNPKLLWYRTSIFLDYNVVTRHARCAKKSCRRSAFCRKPASFSTSVFTNADIKLPRDQFLLIYKFRALLTTIHVQPALLLLSKVCKEKDAEKF